MEKNRVFPEIEEYLTTLRRSCAGIPVQECEEFVNEIRSHLMERVEGSDATTESVTAILEAMGRPQQLAAQLKTGHVWKKASASFSPNLLLRGMFRLALTGIIGFVAFLAAVAGYGCGIASLLTVALKPFFPSHIGLWLSSGRTLTLGFADGGLENAVTYGISLRSPGLFVLGTLGPDGPVRDFAGPWIYLIALGAAAVFLVVTTLFSQRIIARWGMRRGRVPRRATMNPRYVG